jgi:tetratricopeptide (TPR) repeat protein
MVFGDRVLSRYRTDSMQRLFPTLDPVLARHLACDNRTQWDSYCRVSGVRPLIDGWVATWRVANGWSYERFVHDRATFERVSLQMGESLESLYGLPVYARYFRWLETLSPAEDYETHRLSVRYITILADSVSTEERLLRLDRLIAESAHRGDGFMAMSVQSSAAHVELERGRHDLYRTRLEATLSDARALEDDYLACQVLGEFAVLHQAAGHLDSMRTCLDEGILLAKRHRFPEQTARLLLFDARQATEEGRLALAADRLSEASDLVEAYGGGSARLRVALETARFMADASCWDLAAQSLRRLPLLMREFPGRSEADELLKHEFEADCLRARVAFATGDTAEAGRLLGHWVAALPAWHRRVGLGEVFREWSWGLQQAGNAAGALAVCDRGLAHCDTAHVQEFAITLALRRARLLESLGRLDEARRATDAAAARITAAHDVDDEVLDALRIMKARLELHEGRLESGRRMLRAVFLDHRRRRPWTVSPMRLEDFEGLSLCDAVHDLARLSPSSGYGFEIRWRSLSDRPAATARTGRGEDNPFEAVRCDGACTHLLYRFASDRLLRWTASSRGVVLDTLAVSPSVCLTDVREAVTLLQSDRPGSGEWFSPRLATVLRRLASELLPADLAGDTRTIEVTPDGALRGLPFEALPVQAAGGEAPLAMTHDVTYLHAGFETPVGGRGTALILSNPALPAELRRRYSWAGLLNGTSVESETARERWPDATILSGARATKPMFVRYAGHASYLYIAGHHVMDPAAPFLGFIPLAAPPGASRDAALLESTDIRSLDLSGCRLAVLASCASGVPYRSAFQPGPSLGDAFLDAGAASVITSFWDVGDDETGVFMQHLMKHRGLEDDPVATLSRVRRDAMQGRDRVPPRVWAAWSVAVTGPNFMTGGFVISPRGPSNQGVRAAMMR